MRVRWEVSEKAWLEQFSAARDLAVDYLLLDLDQRVERPWLDEARERVELIGYCATAASTDTLERALELDVDFFCMSADGGELDTRRLPLRLIIEQQHEADASQPAGAAWARRLRGWEAADRAGLESQARAGRVFLAGHERLPEASILQQIGPFAVAVPDRVTAEELARYIAV